MAKKIDPKAKAKKQKIYAAVGGVLLLALLAFQVPRTMKMLHPPTAESSAPTAPASTTPASGPIAAPSLSGGNATAVSAPAAGELLDPDAVPVPQSGQLLAFGLFRTKDPFAQQLNEECGAGTCRKSAPAAPATVKPEARTSTAAPSRGLPASTAPRTEAALTRAVILVNGQSESVQVGGQFPAGDPAFTLVSVTATTAKVGIAGGSFENGTPTVKLQKNKPLTLMNTADGMRYVLRLLSVA